MAGSDQFSLRWNNFHSNLSTGFHDLLKEEELVDVTLATEGKLIKAHQVVLSVCSPYFRKMFQINPCKHPIVILTVGYRDLRDILTFIYQGEVNVRQEDLPGFLKAAELLQVKGLCENDESPEPPPAECAKPKIEEPIVKEEIIVNNSPSPPLPEIPAKEQAKSMKRLPFEAKPSCTKSNIKRKKFHANHKIVNCPKNTNEDIFSSINQINCVKQSPERNDLNTACESDVREAMVGFESTLELHHEKSSSSDYNDEENLVMDLLPTNKMDLTDDMSDSENFHLKSEQDLDELMITNANSQITGNTSTDKENGYFPLDGIRSSCFQCLICLKKFVNRYNLKVHIRDKHEPGQDTLSCHICGKVMRNQSCLRVHRYNHRKQFAQAF